jgi:hypothetical protein
MSKPAEKGLTPAYGSYKTMLSFMNDIKELGHIPLRIDRTQMSKLSGAAAKELLATLRFLGLVQGEKAEPTPLFEAFVNGSDNDRRALLEKMLRSSYSFLFTTPGFHIERATGGQVAELFREHGNGISGSTLQRAVSFFLTAAKEADIKVSPSIKPPKSTNTGTRPKREKKNDASTPPAPKDPLGAANEPPAPGVKRLEVPMPDKPSVVIFLPESIDAEDWAMVYDMLKIYVKRWKGYDPENARTKTGDS